MIEQTLRGGATLCAHFLRVVGHDHGSLKTLNTAMQVRTGA